MSELPDYKGANKFQFKKKDGSDSDLVKKKPSIHERETTDIRLYDCPYLIETKDGPEQCPQKFQHKSAWREHKRKHERDLQDKSEYKTSLDGDVLRVLIPAGAHKHWLTDNNIYVFDEHVKLPDGFRILDISQKTENHFVKSEHMIEEVSMSFHVATLVRDDNNNDNNKLKQELSVLKGRLTKLENKLKEMNNTEEVK